MERLFETVLLNALVAAGLAGLVAWGTRRRGHPALVHVLWLLVLAKLVTPAFIPVALLPAGAEDPPFAAAIVPGSGPVAPLPGEWPASGLRPGDVQPPTSASPSGSRTPSVHPAADRTPERIVSGVRGRVDAGLASWSRLARSDRGRALVVANLAIAAAILGLAAARFFRFRRRLAHASEASPPLRRRVAELAAGFGLRRVPRILVTGAKVPPLVAPGPRGAEIVLPAGLLAGLGDAERDSLLAHELAHVARGDAWVRPFELLVTALFWWHPVVWIARRRLRAAEEQACDALVLRTLPGRARDYAEGLLRTLEFLNDRAPTPALATGADTSHLEERLTMIANGSSAKPLPRFRRAALALAGLALLLLAPVARDSERAVAETAAPPAAPRSVAPVPAAEPAPSAEPAPPGTPRAPAPRAPESVRFGGPEEPLPEPLVRLREEEIGLQRQLRELEIRRVRMELELEQTQIIRQMEMVRADIAQLEKEGDPEPLQEMRRVLRSLETDAELQKMRAELEVQHAEARLDIEERLQRLSLERDVAEAQADGSRARSLAVQAREFELQLRSQEIDDARAQLELEAKELETRAKELEAAD